MDKFFSTTFNPHHEFRKMVPRKCVSCINLQVVIGPHGGAFNNLMWTHEDAHIVEFNEFPDDKHFSLSFHRTPVRHVFLAGDHGTP